MNGSTYGMGRMGNYRGEDTRNYVAEITKELYTGVCESLQDYMTEEQYHAWYQANIKGLRSYSAAYEIAVTELDRQKALRGA